MDFKIYAPPLQLAHLVECFWTISTRIAVQQVILPEICTSISFDLTPYQEKILVSGVNTSSRNYPVDQNSRLLGVTFHTGGLHHFTKIPLIEFKDQAVLASDCIPRLDVLVLEQMLALELIEQQYNYLEKLILKIYQSNDSTTLPLSLHIANYLKTHQGSTRPKEIAKYFHISLRQLERIFKKEVGIPIKLYTRIVRFQQVIAAIKNTPEKSLLELAFDYGYYDHAHLHNEIKAFSGKLPSAFR